MSPETIWRASLLTASLLVAVPAAATECVHPTGSGGCHTSIQSAVDAAALGERIDISRGLYNEAVVVATDGVVLNGLLPDDPGAVVIDPDVPNVGDGILINAAGVQVRNLTIRNGSSNGIEVNGDGVTIRNVRVLSPASDCIEINANGTLVINNVLRGPGNNAIDGFGDNLVIRGNRVRITDSTALDLDGDDIQVINNHISQAEDGDCIDLFGARAVVRDNIADNCDGSGVDVFGENPTVVGNTARVTDNDAYEIDCSPCTGGLVAGNRALDVPDDDGGFDIFAAAAGLVVRDNSAERTADQGFDISGTGIVLTGNVAREIGGDDTEAGFEIFGTGHTLRGNSAQGAVGGGFDIFGNLHTLELNVASGNLEDGFDVSGTDVTLTSNRATNNIGEGFAVSGTNTTLNTNFAKRNRTDFCDVGIGTVLNGNNFGTVGACSIEN